MPQEAGHESGAGSRHSCPELHQVWPTFLGHFLERDAQLLEWHEARGGSASFQSADRLDHSRVLPAAANGARDVMGGDIMSLLATRP